MKSSAIALLFVTVSAGCLVVAGNTNTPGTDDLSRYVARKATPGGQTTLQDIPGRAVGTANSDRSHRTRTPGHRVTKPDLVFGLSAQN